VAGGLGVLFTVAAYTGYDPLLTPEARERLEAFDRNRKQDKG